MRSNGKVYSAEQPFQQARACVRAVQAAFAQAGCSLFHALSLQRPTLMWILYAIDVKPPTGFAARAVYRSIWNLIDQKLSMRMAPPLLSPTRLAPTDLCCPVVPFESHHAGSRRGSCVLFVPYRVPSPAPPPR
ncbi:unnamed protein product [Prorocentrum cordatum]|uniref:Uncharacterized protein n=1 Tax=Prorocentrum cordatum TaxID=2364126 RepID=A0ABN9RQN5_9DINO|nr:unnamed protein product [Polarella glacialis]